MSNPNSETTLQPFLDICKNLPPELKELIIAIAVIYISNSSQWALGDTLKRTQRDDFQLFMFILKLFRQKPKLIVDVARNCVISNSLLK
ncbi:unnamed protein product [Ambrosiozyma monospora]|uniref:Unnamed protein product n=1 Tax=Ambrosiozyma monospora TaxID=43982 RepID=A0ACB5SYN4_AMBMO|nr:unnamed protein product [Ambrosiozyma monospora]